MEGFFDVSQMLRSGIYALVHKDNVVYIGKAKLILGRVYQHRVAWGKKRPAEGTKPLKGILFDAIWIRPCDLTEIDDLEYTMINTYKPRYNTLLKNGLPVPLDLTALLADIVGSTHPRPQTAKSFVRRV